MARCLIAPRRLRELLGLAAEDDLLTSIAKTFPDSEALEAFLVINEIPGKFSSRIGD